MRLSSLGISFSLAAFLVFSSAALAQHSSGGGGSSGGSSSSGSSGGGPHSSSSGGSSSSGSSASSHSSGGSVSHSSASSGSSVSHSSSVRGSTGNSSNSGPASSRSGVRESHSNISHAIREPNRGVRNNTATPAKKSFFSFLRHPFRKPEPKPVVKTKPVADLRRPICLRGPCPVCPAGQVHAGGGCVGTVATNRTNHFCSAGEFSKWGRLPAADSFSG